MNLVWKFLKVEIRHKIKHGLNFGHTPKECLSILWEKSDSYSKKSREKRLKSNAVFEEQRLSNWTWERKPLCCVSSKNSSTNSSPKALGNICESSPICLCFINIQKMRIKDTNM